MYSFSENFKNEKCYIVFGLVSILAGVVLGRLASDLFIVNFMSGLFIGLAIPLNLYGVYKVSRKHREQV